MNILPEIDKISNELKKIFKDLHQHPELGFEEVRTSEIVKKRLQDFGVDEIHTNIGKTGVVAVINGKQKGANQIGLRADMDALPIEETTNLDYASKTPGKMHACGHDGHTTMLLGAAKHLCETRNFKGKAILIFQPAEEGLGGARLMLKEGLFEKFPCSEIYGIHNSPNGRHSEISICKGKAMAGASFFDITINAKGSHAAMPHQSIDPIIICANMIDQMQAIVSRNTPPLESVVLSITQIRSGSAYNVIPEEATLCGTIRYFSEEVYALVEDRVKAICRGLEATYNVEVIPDLRNTFDVLHNDNELSECYMDAAEEIVGRENIIKTARPATGSEDFADMLKHVRGAYCRIGHSGTEPLHSPKFTLDPDIIPVGASVLARLVEKQLPTN
ncbi:M20 family metallopeptidase [Paracoccaceae bacterium]|nr:M20 family metallopeptidase [Paracoccaceae bacterium]